MLPSLLADNGVVECGICTAVVSGIQWAVKNNETMDMIEEAALTVCDNLSLGDSSGESVVDCDDKVNMKDLHFIINGHKYTLTPDDYILDIEVGLLDVKLATAVFVVFTGVRTFVLYMVCMGNVVWRNHTSHAGNVC